MFERGVAVVSIDTEQIWGHLDRLDEGGFTAHYPNITATCDRLLDCLCSAGISATWAVVGGLALEGSAGSRDARMAGLPASWVEPVRAGNEQTAPLWYRRAFVRRIRDARPQQDIGLHGGLTHMIWDDPRYSRETLRRELEAGIRALREISIEPRSFVYPRNMEAHHELLAQYGITSYRGPAPVLSERLGRSIAGAAMRFIEELGRFTPPPVWPQESLPGLWNIPASLFLHPMTEARARLVPPRTRVERARLGIEAAARSRGIFHFWLHPSNLAEGPLAFPAFERIIEQLVRARNAGDIEILTMARIVDHMERQREESHAGAPADYAATR